MSPTAPSAARPAAAPASRRPSEARDRLLHVASELFYREGIHAVGLDRVLTQAGVTRATMYRHFPGKEALVAACLDREDALIRASFATALAPFAPSAPDRAHSAPDRAPLAPLQSRSADAALEAALDAVADDLERNHTRGCPFINASVEYPDASSEVRRIIARHRAWFRDTLRGLLAATGRPDPLGTADSLVLLRDAALIGGYLDGAAVARRTFLATAHALLPTP